MKQQEVFKKIGGIINELRDQYEYLVSIQENLNDLELELFVANAHFLADHAEILRKLNLQTSALPTSPKPVSIPEEIPVVAEQQFFEPVAKAIEPLKLDQAENKPERAAPQLPDMAAEASPAPEIELNPHERGNEFSFIRQEPATIRHELILDEADKAEDDDDIKTHFEVLPPAKPVDKQSPVAVLPLRDSKLETPVNKPESIKVKEQVLTSEEEKPLTINQRMSAMRGEQNRNTEQQVNRQPAVSDLKSAITLNDKLLYIKDLFNGYNLAYSEAIDILNRLNNFEEAERLLRTNYATKNHWDNKQATADKFYNLLRRRFGD